MEFDGPGVLIYPVLSCIIPGLFILSDMLREKKHEKALSREKSTAILTIAVLLILSVLNTATLAEKQGEPGRLTKLNVDEATLTEVILESCLPFSRYRFFDNLNSMVSAPASGQITGMAMHIRPNTCFQERKNLRSIILRKALLHTF